MNYRYPRALILIFSKAPVVNQVKTRLMTDLTAQQAVDVHVDLTDNTLRLVSSSHIAPIELWCSPDSGHDYFKQCVDKYDVSLHQQGEGSLGDKMHHAICSGLERAQQVVLIGTDCPSFEVQDFEQAFQALTEGTEIALGPAEDGGYVLIGMSQPHQYLFQDIDWSSQRVLSQTKLKIKELALSHFETKKQWDVDSFEDWLRYQQQVR